MRQFASIFSQMLAIFSRYEFETAVRKHRAERAAKGFDCWTQFVAMLFCQLGRAHSLREIGGGLASVEGKRRLMVVNYTRPKPERIIANFADVLIAEEGAGILNWMIEGAVLYLEDLRGHGTIQLTQEQQKRVELLLAESDSVRMFVNECVIKHDFKDVTVMELQGAYFEYCDEMGWRAFSPTEFKASIVQPMLDIHHVSRRNDIKRGFNGTETHRGFRGVIVGGRGGQ